MLGLGIVAVVAFGTEAVVAASSLLTIAIFVLMFTVLVFVTRVATRVAVSFSIYSRRSIDEAEQAVLNAMETEDKNEQVKRDRRRSKAPARAMSTDSVAG